MNNSNMAAKLATLTLSDVDTVNDVTAAYNGHTPVNSSMTIGDTIIVPAIWTTLLVMGVLGNGLVLYIMMRHAERQTTNCLIINLALSDLTFLIVVIPMTMMHYVLQTWTMGEFMCRFNYYMTYVSIQATCLTLTAMTIDRYFAIVRPMSSLRYRTPTNATITSIGIWIVSLLINVPFALFTGVVESSEADGIYFCRETWPKAFSSWPIVYVVTVSYVLPLTVICSSYALIIRHLVQTHVARVAVVVNSPEGRQQQRRQSMWGDRKRKRAVAMVGVVVGVFAVSWLPIHVYHLWNRFDENFPYVESTYIYKIVAHTLSYANCCINPLIYGCLADGFRKGLRKALPYAEYRQCPSTVNPYSNSRRNKEQTGALSQAVVNDIQLQPTSGHLYNLQPCST